jgi:hypothetical protein
VYEFSGLLFGGVDRVVRTGGVGKTDQHGNADGDQYQQNDV